MRDGTGESNGRPSGVGRCEGGPVGRALETYADGIVESELEEAYDKLEASRSLSPETTEVIARMATRIRDGILASPFAALEENSGSDVREPVADLFELDPERERGSD